MKNRAIVSSCFFIVLAGTFTLILLAPVGKDPVLENSRRTKSIFLRSIQVEYHNQSAGTTLPSVKAAGCDNQPRYDFYRRGRTGGRLTELTPKIDASCALLTNAANSTEARRVRNLNQQWKNSVTDDTFLKDISTCETIVPTFQDNFYISEREANFPLGYVILMSYSKHSVQQYIRLLRFIYRPQNIYCIHIDKKSPPLWIESILSFASCFPNILIAKNAVDVVYASAAILVAHLSCLKELSYSPSPWKYVIDLHGTEIPVVTNREIVEGLEPLHGINPIKEGITIRDIDPNSITYRKMTNKAVLYSHRVGMRLTHQPLGPVPFNMTLYKSADSPNSAFSRQFVNFILTDPRGEALLEYLQDVLSAVEFFFNTLNMLPDAPGGKHERQLRESSHGKIQLPNIVVRHWKNSNHPTACAESYYRHRICIVSASDFYWLYSSSKKRQVYFLNKYLIDYDHVVMDCMEETLLKRNVEEYRRDCL